MDRDVVNSVELASQREPGRGRDARSPRAIPMLGWKDILWRVWREVLDDQIPLIAGSVAFFAILAVFPTMIALISLYGLLADPADVPALISEYAVGMPWETRRLLIQQMTEIARGSSGQLGIGLIVSLLFSLFSAAGGVESLITGINIAYDEKETRGTIKLRLLSMKFTLALLGLGLLGLMLGAVVPAVLETIGYGGVTSTLVRIARWPVLAIVVTLALSSLYRFAPNRARPQWRWVSWGAVLATAIWILATLCLSLYMSSFGSFNRTYGTLAGVVSLLLWMYVTSFAVLLGAEFNAELEHQTAVDSTIGPERPLGERRAYVADTIGERRPGQ